MKFWQNYFQRRRNNLQDLAGELDLNFDPTDEYGLINYMRDFKLFRRGHSRKIKNIISFKKQGMDLDTRVFDYQFIISAGNTHRKVSQSVFFLQSKSLDLPQFYLRPEDFFQRVAKFFGRQDINFERYPEFSGQYLLQSSDENRARNRFSPELLQFFTVEKNWYLEGLGYYLIFYRWNKRLNPVELKEMINKGFHIYDLLTSDLV